MLQKILKVVLPLLFGLGLFWFLFSKVDAQAVGDVIRRGVSWPWVFFSWACALLSHIVRGIRWRMQLQTIGANPSVHEMSMSIFGGYGMNLIFPRLGEMWRCNYISSLAGVPFSTTVGTMISERMVDMLVMMAIAVLTFALQSQVFFDFFSTYNDAGSSLVGLISSPATYVALAICVVAIYALRRFLRGWKIYRYVSGLARNMWEGILSLRKVPHLSTYIFYSLIIWLLYFLNTWVQFYFFDFSSHLGILAALAIFTMGSMSLLIPVQGGLGAWHAMVIFTLGCYGMGETEAFTFALVSWSLEQGFVLLLGLYAMAYTFVNKSRKQ